MAQTNHQSNMTADSHCGNGYCTTAIYSPSTKMINYTMIIPQGGSQVGWYAFAQGEKMEGANMAISWINSDASLTTSHRSGTGDRDPTTDSNQLEQFSINSNTSKTRVGQTIWSWNMPLPSNYPQNAVHHIFAMSPISPTSSSVDQTIHKHSRYEQSIVLDLTKPYSISNSSVNSTSTQSPSMNSDSDTQQSSQRNLNVKSIRIYLVHMILMVFAWQICLPLGILLSRYGRALFTWFPYHRAIMISGILVITIGFVLGITAKTLNGDSHFDNTHSQLGLVLFVLVFIQAILGASAHELRKRKGLRYFGYVHVPFGLVLYGLSVWNSYLGFELWDWNPPNYAKYIICAWAGLIGIIYLAGLMLLPGQLRYDRSSHKEESATSI